MVLFSVILVINFAFCLFLGSFVYYKNPTEKLNRYTLILCIAYAYQTLINFGLTVVESPETANTWFKFGAFYPFLLAFQLHFIFFFTEKKVVLKSKGFYIIVYGWALIFSIIDLSTDLLIGKIEHVGESWVAQNPVNSELWLVRTVSVWVILAMMLVFCGIYLLQTSNEARRAQAQFLFFGLIAFYLIGQYLPFLGLSLICYAVSRYGVNALTAKLSAEIMMNRLPEVLLFIDATGRVQFANSAASATLDYSREELVGLPFDYISAGGNKSQGPLESFEKIKSTGHAGNLELKFRAKNGAEIPLLTSIAEVRGSTGRALGFLYLGREITQIKKREAEWAKSQQELELDSIIRLDFLALQSTELLRMTKVISENLKSLLGSQEEPLSISQNRQINSIFEATQGLDKIGQEMHNISTPGKDINALHRQNFPLKPLLEYILQLFKEQAYNQDLMLISDVPDTIGTIYADKRMIQQLVYNLINNAVHFTPGGGQVGIGAQRSSNEVQVTIWDTGIGIAPDDVAKLFQAFKTVQTPVSQKHEGKGLGLYFCKKYVTLHGGLIWVESQVGKGSKFHFTIPTNGEKNS
ncbi:MAG: signal transduction histidine kinase [Promethearchaeota archaeon CR_4]|nr:MAG: signal transduction histidine kinase [Candidatus Lokiarchaeota archaeon CR_4]